MKTQHVDYKDDLISFRMVCLADGRVLVSELWIDFRLAGWDRRNLGERESFAICKERLFNIGEMPKTNIWTPPSEKVAESPEFKGIQLRTLMALEGMKRALELLRGPM